MPLRGCLRVVHTQAEKAVLQLLASVDIKTLCMVLVFGNFISVFLIVAYWVLNKDIEEEPALMLCYALAKVLQGGAFWLLLLRGSIDNFLSVNIGNLFVFIGFYLEACAMLIIAQEKYKIIYKIVTGILIVSIVSFNIVEIYSPDSSIRIFIASICVFFIFAIPNLRMVFSRYVSMFKRIVGVLYLSFLVLLLPRAVYALMNQVHVHSNFFIQTFTYISLVFLLLYSLPTCLLLMKEKTDAAIASMATTDFLTGLQNRRSFLADAQRLFDRHKMARLSVALIYFDIDHFKKANDTYGHEFGDAILRQLGTIMLQTFRASDFCCRYGGEEFVVFLTPANADTALMAMRRLAAEITKASFKEQPEFCFTVSGGIASGVPSENETLEVYIKRADKALYEAKNTSRNKVVEWKP